MNVHSIVLYVHIVGALGLHARALRQRAGSAATFDAGVRGRVRAANAIASDARLLKDPLPSDAIRLYVSNDHHANFIDCVRSRKATICPAEVGHRSVSVCHIGNISLRLGGRKLAWDPATERFTGDEDANRMLDRPKRGPWKI